MQFKDRIDAAHQLAPLLEDYRGEDTLVLGLPRGGVVLAAEIAKELGAELNVIFAHKIGHPFSPEYAIAATSESGHLVGPSEEVDRVWLDRRIEEEQEQMQERRKLYLGPRKRVSCQGRRVLLVDDGLATGLTMRAAILEVQAEKPKEVVVAVPVTPKSTWKEMELLAPSLQY